MEKLKFLTLLDSNSDLSVLQPVACRHADCVTETRPLLCWSVELYGLSPRPNYTDRATAACRRSDCQLFADIGCHVVSVTDPYGRIFGFLDRSRYFSIK
jgi:hypothetical protein